MRLSEISCIFAIFKRWIYVLKHMETLEKIPFATQKKIFKRLADIADSRCLTKEEMAKYEESQNIVDNYNLGMYGAWLKGSKEGEKKANFNTARNLLQMGLTVNQIMQATGLTQEQVNSLKN